MPHLAHVALIVRDYDEALAFYAAGIVRTGQPPVVLAAEASRAGAPGNRMPRLDRGAQLRDVRSASEQQRVPDA